MDVKSKEKELGTQRSSFCGQSTRGHLRNLVNSMDRKLGKREEGDLPYTHGDMCQPLSKTLLATLEKQPCRVTFANGYQREVVVLDPSAELLPGFIP